MPFSASIISRDFISIFDNALVLGGASYLRTLTCGAGWSRIRLGALVAVTPNSTSNIVDVPFIIGVCSGKSYPGSSNLPANAFGVSFNGNYTTGAARTLTYNANSSYPYYAPTTGSIYRRVGTTQFTSAGMGALFLPLANTGIQKRRFPVILDITRSLGGSGLATVTIYGVAVAATAQLDFRPDDLQSALDQLGIPIVRNTTLSAGPTLSTINISDDAGPLDTFEIFWGSETYPLEIYALGAVIINPTQNTATNTVFTNPGGVFDTLQQYTGNTQALDFGSFGTDFSGAGTVLGSSYGTTVMGLPGTSGGVPYETFEQYSLGSVTSNVTINAGTGWTGNAFIY